MTRARGQLWKTPWKRSRQAPAVPRLTRIQVFTGFVVDDPSAYRQYEQPIGTNRVGGSVPFWIGMVATSRLEQPSDLVPSFLRGGSDNHEWRLVGVAAPSVTPAPIFATITNGVVLPAPSIPQPAISTCFESGTTYAAHAALLAVTDQGSSYRVQFWLNGVSRRDFVIPAFSLDEISVVIRPGPRIVGGPEEGIGSWAGGNAALTFAEIDRWFQEVRNTGEAVGIDGKTLDLFSASAYPLGPAPLLLSNSGSGVDCQLASVGGGGTAIPSVDGVLAVFAY